jgi:hypothetical protein
MAQIAAQQLTLQLKFIAGKNQDGKDTFKVKAYRNVRVDVNPDKLLEVATGLASLQVMPLDSINIATNGQLA